MTQSHTTTVLQMLSEGELSAKEMASRSGLSQRQVEYAMQQLRKGYAIRAMNRPYQITKEGTKILKRRIDLEARLAEKAETLVRQRREKAVAAAAKLEAKVRDADAARAEKCRLKHEADEKRIADEQAARQAKEAQEAIAFAAVHRRVDASQSRDSIVAGAIASAPALHAVWGAMACA